MRIISLHCDYIKFKPVKKAIKNAEEIKENEEKEILNPLVILTAVERGDNDEIIREMVSSVQKIAKDVGADKVVLYPYAHLSSNLSDPETAKEYLVEAESALKKLGFEVVRAPFGYYKEFELKCKGHPLSELSKEFRNKSQLEKEIDSKKIEKQEKPEKISSLLKEASRSKLDTSKLKENDHRIIGQKLDLFSFNESSPGSVFWHPKGQIIFNELVNFSRELQSKMGYKEVATPIIFDNKLWKISGHWDHYKENMFITEYEKGEFAIKPMNCPGHMLLFRAKTVSYKDLPIRFSEYTSIHRMELSGVLAGLFRLIHFHQDDSHIFCSFEQLEAEIVSIVELINIIYKKTFAFNKIEVKLSTRPDNFIGDINDWNKAEEILKETLKKTKMNFQIKEGEGAFYGPKIDFDVEDSLGRKWQCSTIQLDMQLPKRFDLKYIGGNNKKYEPLVIHRAVFGSIERFIGVLLEHTNGALPLWLSPIQVRVLNFTDRNVNYAKKVIKQLTDEIPYLRVDYDFRNTTINDKIRDAELEKINYIIVLGDKEEKANSLAVRERGKKPVFNVKINVFLSELKDRIKNRN